MKPLLVLLLTFVVTLASQYVFTKKTNCRMGLNVALSIMLLFTAMGHFMFAEGMATMLPAFVPFPVTMVWLTGFAEIGFAVLLPFALREKLVGYLLIAFFLLILPANIYAAVQHINYQTGETTGPGPAYLWFRIPLQVLFVLWVYWGKIKLVQQRRAH